MQNKFFGALFAQTVSFFDLSQNQNASSLFRNLGVWKFQSLDIYHLKKDDWRQTLVK